ncbi:proline-rich protein 36-like [Vulpes lagopus]|uniref:proline-rich protein 36-like n=1 Tax=Vulpes lagopus TaxID=494514 RepID=UPI001BC9E719|nr:proline-rich protein 36-like [Vulpes lagopus]
MAWHLTPEPRAGGFSCRGVQDLISTRETSDTFTLTTATGQAGAERWAREPPGRDSTATHVAAREAGSVPVRRELLGQGVNTSVQSASSKLHAPACCIYGPASLITLRRLHAEQVSGRSDCSLPLYGLLAVLSASHVAHSMPGRKKKVVFAVIRACPSGSAEEPGDERGRCSTCGVVLAGLREGGQQGALPRPGAGKNGPPGKGQTETHTCCAQALSRGTSRQDLRMSTTAAWKGCDSSREDGKKEVSAESGQEGAGWGPDKCERESRQQMTFSGAWKGAAAPEKPPQTAHRLLRRPTGEGRFHEVPEGGQSRWQGDLATQLLPSSPRQRDCREQKVEAKAQCRAPTSGAAAGALHSQEHGSQRRALLPASGLQSVPPPTSEAARTGRPSWFPQEHFRITAPPPAPPRGPRGSRRMAFTGLTTVSPAERPARYSPFLEEHGQASVKAAAKLTGQPALTHTLPRRPHRAKEVRGHLHKPHPHRPGRGEDPRTGNQRQVRDSQVKGDGDGASQGQAACREPFSAQSPRENVGTLRKGKAAVAEGAVETPNPAASLQSLGCRDTGSGQANVTRPPQRAAQPQGGPGEAAQVRRGYRVPPPPWRARVGGRRATTCPQPRPTSGGRKDSQGFGPRGSHLTTTRTLGQRKQTSGARTGSGTGSGMSAIDTSRTTGPVVRAVATRLGADASPGTAAPSAARPPPSREWSTPPAPHRGSLRHRGLSGSPAATASQDSCLHCRSHTRGTHLTTPRCRRLYSHRMRDSQCPPDPLPRRAPPPTGKLQAGSGSSPSRFWLRRGPPSGTSSRWLRGFAHSRCVRSQGHVPPQGTSSPAPPPPPPPPPPPRPLTAQAAANPCLAQAPAEPQSGAAPSAQALAAAELARGGPFCRAQAPADPWPWGSPFCMGPPSSSCCTGPGTFRPRPVQLLLHRPRHLQTLAQGAPAPPRALGQQSAPPPPRHPAGAFPSLSLSAADGAGRGRTGQDCGPPVHRDKFPFRSRLPPLRPAPAHLPTPRRPPAPGAGATAPTLPRTPARPGPGPTPHPEAAALPQPRPRDRGAPCAGRPPPPPPPPRRLQASPTPPPPGRPDPQALPAAAGIALAEPPPRTETRGRAASGPRRGMRSPGTAACPGPARSVPLRPAAAAAAALLRTLPTRQREPPAAEHAQSAARVGPAPRSPLVRVAEENPEPGGARTGALRMPSRRPAAGRPHGGARLREPDPAARLGSGRAGGHTGLGPGSRRAAGERGAGVWASAGGGAAGRARDCPRRWGQPSSAARDPGRDPGPAAHLPPPGTASPKARRRRPCGASSERRPPAT